MKLKQSLIIAATLGVILVAAWELYWRSQGRQPNIDDNKNLWANQRAKLEHYNDNTVVFIGSSRILYDIQLDIWIDETNTDPVMLAAQGTSPLPIFRDIVDNTDFNGTLLVGVTPPLLFSTTYPEANFIKVAQSLVDYYDKRTYAQKLNHKLSIPLQKNLAFIRDGDQSWDTDVDLKMLLSQIHLKERTGPFYPPFNNFESITLDRHMKMPQKMVTDTAYSNSVKKVWAYILGGDFPPPEREATINATVELAKKFQARGGNLIFLRCPSSGLFRKIESLGFPRNQFWDILIENSGGKAYHYEDYEQFHNLNLPEWSHLAEKDARFFTTELLKIMKADGALTNSKSD